MEGFDNAAKQQLLDKVHLLRGIHINEYNVFRSQTDDS
jgi:hypothetical protein